MAQSENQPLRDTLRSWLIPILIAIAVVAWGLTIYFLVGDRPRAWDFGVLPAVPSQGIYSTEEPPASPKAPRQMVPLPEAASRQDGSTER